MRRPVLFAREALEAGAGVGSLPSFLADADVAAGTLRRLLPWWRAFTGTVFLVQPSGSPVPRKVEAFGEALAEVLRGPPLEG